MTRRNLAAGALAAALLAGACADGDDGDGDGAPPTTVAASAASEPAPTVAPSTAAPARSSTATADPATTVGSSPATTAPATSDPSPTSTPGADASATAYAAPGPFPVGVTTLALPSGPSVEVWYPAVEGTSGSVSYDVRDFTPPAVRDLLTGDVPSTFSFDGGRDVEVAGERFPLVLFSHGFTGIRLQSSFLTSHLASWGMVVAAPDHPSRDLANVLGGTASGEPLAAVGDLLATLDLLLAEDATPGSRFAHRIDGGRVAAVGHSAGGGTVLLAAADERVDGYVSMAAGGPDDVEAFPDRPSFFLAGALDGVVEPARTTAAFERAPPPARLWVMDGVGHNGFDDFCTFGGGTGIIGVAEASGLGGVLDAQPRLRALGEDGCVPPAAPVEQAFPIVRHGVTAWLRALFGDDARPVGLGPEVDGAFALAVTTTERP